jgi:hypothetical protein
MAKKDDLRLQRANTVINNRSKVQEKAMVLALRTVVGKLMSKFPDPEALLAADKEHEQ